MRTLSVSRASLDCTVRIIGIASAARGKSIDIALLETDAGQLVRQIDLERRPLDLQLAADEAVADILRRFMGDRALQPFAIDALALATSAMMTAQWLGQRLEIATFDISAASEVAEAARRRPKRYARAEVLALAAAGCLARK